jgi:hypothetical protein
VNLLQISKDRLPGRAWLKKHLPQNLRLADPPFGVDENALRIQPIPQHLDQRISPVNLPWVKISTWICLHASPFPSISPTE